MVELAGLGIGVALLCAVGLMLDATRAPRWVGGIPLVVAGGITGFVGTIVLALAIWPGACVAALCPSCYREPSVDAVWRATLVFSAIVGVLAVAIPGDRFRVGFTLAAAPGILDVSGDAVHAGAGGAVLLAGAVTLGLWAVRHEIGVWRRESADGTRPGGGHDASSDFWDGARWGAPPRDADADPTPGIAGPKAS